MCGSYVLIAGEKFGIRFGVSGFSKIPTTFNARPSQVLPVITMQEGQKSVELMSWGYIPSWAKDAKRLVINARVETIIEKPYFRGPIKRNRCLVPASGFYEWQATDSGKKQPHYFYPTHDEYFALAGIYSLWEALDGSSIPTYAIITGKPNKVVEPIHDRMPLILEKDEEDIWLQDDERAQKIIEDVISVYPAAKLSTYPVSLLVNNPKNNGEELITPLAFSTPASATE
jgi:putative SOS response-associated peptidase YedK